MRTVIITFLSITCGFAQLLPVNQLPTPSGGVDSQDNLTTLQRDLASIDYNFKHGGGGNVVSVTLIGTAGQITLTGTCTITTSGTCTFSLPSALTLPGTINKLTLTAPATGATVTIADTKTFTVNSSITLNGTDGVVVTFPATSATVATLGLTNTFSGRQDATGAASTAPMKSGTVNPATCTVGDLFFNTTSTAGTNIWECTSTNVFTQQTGGGTAGANTALSNLSAVSVNTSILAQTNVDLGSTANPFRDAFLFGGGTYGSTYIRITGTPTSTRVWTIPDVTDIFVGLSATQTLTNKTLTTPTISSFTNATHNHSNAAGGGILAMGTAIPNLSGDCTTSNSSALTCVSTNGVSFSPSATTDTTNASNISSGTLAAGRVATLNQNTTGTSGNITGIALGANGGTGVANTGKTITMGGNVVFSGVFAPTFVIPSTSTWTFPSGNDTLVTLTATQTLTNKTLISPALTGTTTAQNLIISGTCTGCSASSPYTSIINAASTIACNYPTTDDTAAWNTLLSSPGGTIIMPSPPCTSEVTNLSITANGITLDCEGGTIKEKAAGSGVMLNGNGVIGFVYRNCNFDGDNLTGITNLIEFDNSSGIYSENNNVTNVSTLGGGASLFSMGEVFYNTAGNKIGGHTNQIAGAGISLTGSSTMNVSKVEVDHTYKNGITLNVSAPGSVISDNYVHDIHDGGPSGSLGAYGNGVFCSNSSACSIKDNVITKTEYSGIRSGSSTGVSLVGNVLDTTGDWAILVEFASSGASITGNKATNVGGGINCANGAAPDANLNYNCNISGNHVFNAQGSAINSGSVFGNCFTYTTGTLMTGNTCDGAYWGILGETSSATDSPTPNVHVSENSVVDTRPVTLVASAQSGTIAVGDQVYVGSNWVSATKRGIVLTVASATHITIKTIYGFFAASDSIKDDTSPDTASTFTVSTVTGPELATLALSTVTNFNIWDTVTAGSGSTQSVGVITCMPAPVTPSINSVGCPTALNPVISIRSNGSGLLVPFPSSGTLTDTVTSATATISASAITNNNMRVAIMTNTDTSGFCSQEFTNNTFGSYAVQPYGSASGSPPSTTINALGSGICIRRSMTGNTPSISSGFGTNPALVGTHTDTDFTVNIGTGGTAASGVIAWGVPYTTLAPNCIASDQGSILAVQPTPTTTQITLAVAGAYGVSDLVSVHCAGGN